MINKDLNEQLINKKNAFIDRYGLDRTNYTIKIFIEDEDINNLDELGEILDYLKSKNIDLNSEFAMMVFIHCFSDATNIFDKIDYVIKHNNELSPEEKEIVISTNNICIDKKLNIFRKYKKIYELSPFEGYGELILKSTLEDIDERVDFIYSEGICDEYGEIGNLKEQVLNYTGKDYKEVFKQPTYEEDSEATL